MQRATFIFRQLERRGRRLPLIVVLAISGWGALAAPSSADEPTLTHLGHLMADEAAGENAPELNFDFWQKLAFDGLPIQPEQTRLEDIQERLGGNLHAHDAAAGTETWLCFTKPAGAATRAWTVWFGSATDGAVPDGHPVTLMAVQEVDAAASDGCAAAPGDSGSPSFGVPGLGAATVELRAHFGQLPYDRVHNVYYDSVRPLGDGSGKSVYQRLGYMATQRGVVVGVAVTQTTN